jgi:PAS domain-containing protein
MEERRPVEFEETFTGGDGVARVFRTVKAPLLNPAGVVIGLVGLSGEVTESRRARDELGRLNAHLEERVAEALAERKLWADLFEATDAFIAVVGPDLRLLALTGLRREIERLGGVTPRLGLRVTDLYPDQPEIAAAAKDPLEPGSCRRGFHRD